MKKEATESQNEFLKKAQELGELSFSREDEYEMGNHYEDKQNYGRDSRYNFARNEVANGNVGGNSFIINYDIKYRMGDELGSQE